MATGTPGSQSALREANLHRVLRAVRAVGSLTQAEIVRATGLSAATVSTIVRELAASALVVVTPTAQGRRAQMVSLSPLNGLAIGIEMGHAHLRGAIYDMGYQKLIEEPPIDFDIAQSPEEGLRTVVCGPDPRLPARRRGLVTRRRHDRLLPGGGGRGCQTAARCSSRSQPQ